MEEPEQNDITSARATLQLDGLLELPYESLQVEYKGWLSIGERRDDATLAKALIAMANSGGGIVVLGFSEVAGALVPDTSRTDISSYTSDAINAVVGRYAEPAFHVDVLHVAHVTGRAHPIIVVPGDGTVPVRSKRDADSVLRQNAYYIRRPGPKSEPPQTAAEWDDLLQRCLRNQQSRLRTPVTDLTIRQASGAPNDSWISSSLERYNILANENRKARFTRGSYVFAYQVQNFPAITLPELRDYVVSTKGRETGWPVWWAPESKDIAPYVIGDTLECYIGVRENVDDAHADFWRISVDGKLFLLRGFQEDGDIEGITPGTAFDLTLPIWRVGEAILHAFRFSARSTQADPEIQFSAVWRGLAGRVLGPVARGTESRPLFNEYKSREDSVRSDVSFKRSDVRDGVAELSEAITRRLYASFNLFVIDSSIVREEARRMMRGI